MSVRIVPVRLTSRTRANTSGSCSSSRRMIPAKHTAASRRSWPAIASSTAPGAVTSPSTRSTPSAVGASAAPSPIAVTCAPAAANPCATASPIPLVAPVTRTRRPAKSKWHRVADELVGVVGPEADLVVVLAAHVDLREDVLVAGRLAPRIDVDHRRVDGEHRDHLRLALGDDERVRLARGLEEERARLGDPVVLEVVPAALDDVAGDRHRMAVAADDPRPPDAQQVAPVALPRVQQQRAEVQALGLRHPDPLVLRDARARRAPRRPPPAGTAAGRACARCRWSCPLLSV